MRNRFDLLNWIQQYQGPLLQSHGTGDSLVPIEQGRTLFETAPSRDKTFVQIPGADHSDLQTQEYYEELARFFRRVGT